MEIFFHQQKPAPSLVGKAPYFTDRGGNLLFADGPVQVNHICWRFSAKPASTNGHTSLANSAGVVLSWLPFSVVRIAPRVGGYFVEERLLAINAHNGQRQRVGLPGSV